WDEYRLARILDGCIADAEAHEIDDVDYLRTFGLDPAPAPGRPNDPPTDMVGEPDTTAGTSATNAGRPAVTAGELWAHLYREVGGTLPAAHAAAVELILDQGTLARRVVRTLGPSPEREAFRRVYGHLAACLQDDRGFRPEEV
ncbi:MAG: hypothetical protein ACOCUW_04415, partial [Gemmatimonadota bacterium]